MLLDNLLEMTISNSIHTQQSAILNIAKCEEN